MSEPRELYDRADVERIVLTAIQLTVDACAEAEGYPARSYVGWDVEATPIVAAAIASGCPRPLWLVTP